MSDATDWQLPSDVAWCHEVFSITALHGVWAVPRSGLVFQKTSLDPPTFTLSEVMPHMPGMPLSAHDLLDYQRSDLAAIREKFAIAQIAVEGDLLG